MTEIPWGVFSILFHKWWQTLRWVCLQERCVIELLGDLHEGPVADKEVGLFPPNWGEALVQAFPVVRRDGVVFTELLLYIFSSSNSVVLCLCCSLEKSASLPSSSKKSFTIVENRTGKGSMSLSSFVARRSDIGHWISSLSFQASSKG